MGAGRGAQAGVRGCAGRRRLAAAARERSGRVGVRGSWAQAQASGRALGARQGAGRAAGRALGSRQAGAGRAAGRRWARGRQALGARGARGLGAWAGLGQCTRCTRPIFDPF